MAQQETAQAIVAAILDPVAVDQVVMVPLELIDATDRLREVDEAYATVLAGAFAGPGGQRTPVEIVRRGDRFRLVFGAHRYRAAQIAQLPGIKAIITEADDAELRLREIDENLIRNELSALDRARFLAERKRLYEALNPAAKHGGDRRSDQAANLATWSFSADIADKTGLSERTVQRAVALAEALSPEVVKALLGLIGGLVESQTRARFDERETPEGEAWAPWSESYAATRNSGQSLLLGSGAYRDSYAWDLTGDELRVGSNMVQAALLNFGGTSDMAPGPAAVPARLHLGVSDANVTEIEDAMGAHIEGLMQ